MSWFNSKAESLLDNTDPCDNIVTDSNKQVSKLEVLIQSLQSELLLGKTYKFLPIIQTLKNKVKSAKLIKYTYMVNIFQQIDF